MKSFALTVLVVIATACSASPGPSPGAFQVDVYPAQDPVAVRAAIPGEKTSFLVAVSGTSQATVSATATGATVDRILPATLTGGQVAEVWLTIDPTITTDTTATATIRVTSGGTTRTFDRTIQVMPMTGEGRERDARPHFEFWTAWLAAHHPELGITAATSWQPEFVSTLLIVSHMSYVSADWELGLAWHAATIPPNDWSQIYLRRRTSEAKPSLAFKLDSFAGATAPYQVTPPESVVR